MKNKQNLIFYSAIIGLLAVMMLIKVFVIDGGSILNRNQQEPIIFSQKGNKFYIHGITLGDRSNDVIRQHGQPIGEGVNELTLDPTLEYENFSVTYNNENKNIYDISFQVYNDSMELEFFRVYDGDVYTSENNSNYYFYKQGNDQLIVFKGLEDPAMGYHAYLTFVDENFLYSLRDGYIQPFVR